MENTNSALKELHSFIIENEDNDSDAWTIGGYDDDVIRILETYFTDFDWGELENELESWSTNHLEIFSYCIVNGQGKQGIPEIYTGNIDQRINLLPKLLSISKDRGSNEIGTALFENIEFLNTGNPIALEKLNQIAEYFEFSNRIKANIKNDSILENLQIAFNRASR